MIDWYQEMCQDCPDCWYSMVSCWNISPPEAKFGEPANDGVKLHTKILIFLFSPCIKKTITYLIYCYSPDFYSFYYLELSLGHQVGTEQRSGQQPRTDDDVLALVQQSQGGGALPLAVLRKHSSTGFTRNRTCLSPVSRSPQLTWYFKMASSKQRTS